MLMLTELGTSPFYSPGIGTRREDDVARTRTTTSSEGGHSIDA